MLKFKIVLVVLLSNVFFVNAQEDEINFEDVDISMEFNKSLYSDAMKNIYFSEEPKAMLMGMLAPQSIEDLNNELGSDFSGGELKNIKKGETKIDGIDILYVVGSFVDESGEEFAIEMLAKKHDNKSSILVVSFYEINKKGIFGEEAKNAILSARVK